MTLPTRESAEEILTKHVKDDYQRHHALMVGTVLEGYANKLQEDTELWFLTGFLHDLDYDEFPDTHPGPSLTWFRDWNYPEELIHAVEAHADGFNGFTTKPQTPLAKALVACDEICGIFYAYKKLNPIPYGDMKVKSILKRIKEERFAPGINRTHVINGCENFGLSLEEHVENLLTYLKKLD